MKNSTHTLDLAHEIIGFDEIPPRDYTAPVLVDLRDLDPVDIWEFDLIGFDEDVPACMARDNTRSPMGTDAAWDVLDEAYDSGVESQAVFLAHLIAVNIPECEGLRHLTEWRQSHTDPWIRAHDEAAELHCK